DFGNTVTCVDIDAQKIESLKKGEIPIYEPGLADVVIRNSAVKRLQFTSSMEEAVAHNDVIFIAVGTPAAEDGSADLSYVETVARDIGKTIASYKVVVDKSTVPVGTGRKVKRWIDEEIAKRAEQGDPAAQEARVDVVSNPEFLREGAAVQDFTHPDRIVIGTESEHARTIMKDVYRSLYLNETPYIETNLESAEMIKYASNGFLAVKISFINEIANLCEKTGANVRDVALGMGKDGRIGAKFLHPGPGYGGSCFPKDTRALAKIGREHNENQRIVETTIEINERQKLRAAEKIEAALGSLQGKTLCLLGLAFKPNTDDTRESPAIAIAEYLASRGAKIRVYDPAAMKEAAWRLASIQDSLYFAADEYDAMLGANALIIATEWNQFRNINLAKAKELLASPYFFDLRNIYKSDKVLAMGFEYYGIGY
ncbi:MAG: UDP-glucose/GDP-mannose dehydrogenase family protein, partial [Treponema sp.]|nr:UDP-glucose/GDP-mannose dehydrogenase family protein [Treponema sp.]